MTSIFDSGSLRPVTVCGQRIARSTHICAFFDSDAQEMECVAPYFAEGLDNGELVFTIRERARCQSYLERLSAQMKRDIEPYRASGQLRQLSVEESYLREEQDFEPVRMYEAIEEVLRQSEADGYPRVRTCGDMNWAVALPHIDSLMEYEARVNLLTSGHDCTFMCVYDLNRFSGRTVMDVLSTHPLVLMGNKIYENPYYVDPRDFIRSLARRGSGRLARQDA
jgi:hypothetical protein